jgi:hypothetical protein
MVEPKPTIIICDDDGNRVKRWARTISAIPEVSENYDVVAWEPGRFATAFYGLKQRQLAGRRAGVEIDVEATKVLAELDRATLVVVDFDLTPTSSAPPLDHDALQTLNGSFGDQVAYLTRCFSGATYTVLVNEGFFQSTFDLTHQAFARSSADLNVAHDDLGRVELWTGTSDGLTFRPWHWPRLIDSASRLEALAGDLDLDSPVLASLGLDDQLTLDQFVPEQLDLFGSNPLDVTFRQATMFPSSFKRVRDDLPMPEEHLPKVAVAAVSHWLERIVLPAQNVLIDGPHLVQRRPGLAVDPNPLAWRSVTDLSTPDQARSTLDQDLLADATVPSLAGWVSRPVWLWHRCPRTRIRAEGAPYVFCEDVSAFHPLDDALEYRSSVPGSFSQRFILNNAKTEGLAVHYWPGRRLFADETY